VRGRVGTFGGIAVCFRENLAVQVISVDIPDHLEMMFLKIHGESPILMCVCYRPQWQGREPLTYLQSHLDALLQKHECSHAIIVGDLNQYLVARAFDELLTVHGLTNHVDFATHISGSSLDPVISDLSSDIITCSQLGTVGSSDHFAVHTQVITKVDREENTIRTNWLWNKGKWASMHHKLRQVSWDKILSGDINDQVSNINDVLLTWQRRFIPSQRYKCKPGDQPWFGYQCRTAADLKSRAWRRYKQHPTNHNKQLHKMACKNMHHVQKRAIEQWKNDLQQKLSGRIACDKVWWTCIKQQQGLLQDDTIPPLTKPDKTTAITSEEKAQVLATHFASKMSVPDLDLIPPSVPLYTKATLKTISIKVDEVKKILRHLDTNKAMGGDQISPRLLKGCADQLAEPLCRLFNNCLQRKQWPCLWKSARVAAIHKKSAATDPNNYRPISLLSVVSKIFETIIAEKLTRHFDGHRLLNEKQFGFRAERSASDLLLVQSSSWSQALDDGQDTYVIALDIAGAFDRVWHRGIISKLRSFGISGDLLDLLQNYLHGRSLSVVVNGHSSTECPISASVPQGSVLGPLCFGTSSLMTSCNSYRRRPRMLTTARCHSLVSETTISEQ